MLFVLTFPATWVWRGFVVARLGTAEQAASSVALQQQCFIGCVISLAIKETLCTVKLSLVPHLTLVDEDTSPSRVEVKNVDICALLL
jgi:hypothetical protein